MSPTSHTAHRATVQLPLGDRLHLLVALCCGLTGTPWGLLLALVVLAVLVTRRSARRTRARSVATGRGVLAPAHHAHLLHATGQRREAA